MATPRCVPRPLGWERFLFVSHDDVHSRQGENCRPTAACAPSVHRLTVASNVRLLPPPPTDTQFGQHISTVQVLPPPPPPPGGGGGGGGGGVPALAASALAGSAWMTEMALHPTERETAVVAQKIATQGVGEKTAAHGITLVVGDAKELLRMEDDGDPVYGAISDTMFDLRDKGKTLDDFKPLQALSKEDGAIVVDRDSRAVVCGNYFVGNLLKGERGKGGARHQAASAMAQQAGGCFVIKVTLPFRSCRRARSVPSCFLFSLLRCSRAA